MTVEEDAGIHLCAHVFFLPDRDRRVAIKFEKDTPLIVARGDEHLIATDDGIRGIHPVAGVPGKLPDFGAGFHIHCDIGFAGSKNCQRLIASLEGQRG